MVIRRCAWHRRYFGYPAVCGVAGWGGGSLRFSDWMCRRCAARVRGELGHSAPSSPTEPPAVLGWDPVVVTPPAIAMLAMLAMILMVANPLDQLPPVVELEQRPNGAFPEPPWATSNAAPGVGVPTVRGIASPGNAGPTHEATLPPARIRHRAAPGGSHGDAPMAAAGPGRFTVAPAGSGMHGPPSIQAP